MIGVNGDQLGIKTRQEALEIAGNVNMDLVMVSPNAKPPVCKIMDYGKYRFEYFGVCSARIVLCRKREHLPAVLWRYCRIFF